MANSLDPLSLNAFTRDPFEFLDKSV